MNTPVSATSASSMSLRDVWLHLRLPFSQYLLPICLLALVVPPGVGAGDWGRVIWVLLVIHALMYTAANTFNSYYDRDEGSINGLETPPPVDRTLFWTSMGLEVLALAGAVLVNGQFVFLVFIYGVISKAYSHPAIRIKKRPFASWLIVSFFQGTFVFLMTYIILHDLPLTTLVQPATWALGVRLGALVSLLNMLALSPISQVYQHAEDAKRGDMTISRLLGVRGTFVTAWVCLLLSAVCFFMFYAGGWPFWLMAALLTPGIGYLVWLTIRIWHNPAAATFRAAMWMTRLTGWAMNLFFLILLVKKA